MQKLKTHLKFIPTLALLVILCCADSGWAQQPAVIFSGRVTDQNTGEGIAGVAITCQGKQTGTRVVITDAQGNYTLPFGANSTIKLRAYKTGYLFSPLSSEFIAVGATMTGTWPVNFTATQLPFPLLIFAQPPILLTEDGSLNALALDSVLHIRDPLPVVNGNYFGADTRTRLKLFLVDLDLYRGETLSIITVQAQDSQLRTYNLPVEDLRKVPNVPWLSQLTVRLPNELAGVRDITLSVFTRGQASNQTKLQLK